MGIAHRIKCCVPLLTRLHYPHWLLRLATMRNYKRYHGYAFDLDNPVLFTEKILWYMTEYNQCDQISRITDKVLFKEYVKEHIGDGHTIPMFGHWDNVKDFSRDWEALPDCFVLKSNIQGSGRCIKIIKDKSKVDLGQLLPEIREWLYPANTLHDDYTCRMYNSKPQILAEKYEAEFGEQLNDYKFFCFSGEPYCMYVAQEQFTSKGNYPISFYDLNWERMPVSYGNHPVGEAKRPKHYEEMLNYAKVLSQGFPFVRVDFFDTNDRLYLAELTFSPGGACYPYKPESFNRELGDKFIIEK